MKNKIKKVGFLGFLLAAAIFSFFMGNSTLSLNDGSAIVFYLIGVVWLLTVIVVVISHYRNMYRKKE